MLAMNDRDVTVSWHGNALRRMVKESPFVRLTVWLQHDSDEGGVK